MNKHIIVGTIGKDPEVRYSGETAIANISIATNDFVKGEKVTDWHNCIAFGKSAETLEKYFSKGDSITIEGKVKTRKWKDKDGNTRYSTETVVERLEFVGKNAEKSTLGDAAQKTKAAAAISDDAFDDDIPF